MPQGADRVGWYFERGHLPPNVLRMMGPMIAMFGLLVLLALLGAPLGAEAKPAGVGARIGFLTWSMCDSESSVRRRDRPHVRRYFKVVRGKRGG